MTTKAEVDALIERLGRQAAWKDEYGEYRYDNVNPDGPAAIAMLRSQQEEISILNAKVQAFELDVEEYQATLRSQQQEIERLRENEMRGAIQSITEQLRLTEAVEAAEARAIAAEKERDALREALENPPRHDFWGAGEPDCPKEIKASNGELHTLRCKRCGQVSPRDDICRAALTNSAGVVTSEPENSCRAGDDIPPQHTTGLACVQEGDRQP